MLCFSVVKHYCYCLKFSRIDEENKIEVWFNFSFSMLLLLPSVYNLMMEGTFFTEVPVQPVNLHYGNNSWLPAYGFETPAPLLSKEEYYEKNGK